MAMAQCAGAARRTRCAGVARGRRMVENRGRMNATVRPIGRLLMALLALPCGAGAAEAGTAPPAVWAIDNVQQIGGYAPVVLGAPAPDGGGLRFNGTDDGLILPVNPIAGCAAYTIEVLFEPAPGGAAAQRFLHIEDEQRNRTLMEIRMEPDGRWCLDTFLLSGATRLTLIDRSRLHAAGRRYWVALRCDGRRMAHFVDGVKELDEAVGFTPFAPGRMALGVRLTRESWFKGVIREVRIHPAALADAELQRMP